MRGLSSKQLDPLWKRKAATAGARGGNLCFGKETMIKGQRDYSCISADPYVCFFSLPTQKHWVHCHCLEDINWKASFICLEHRTGWQKPRSREATKLRGVCQKRKRVLGIVWRGERMAKVQRGHAEILAAVDSLWPPATTLPVSQEVIQTSGPQISLLRQMKDSQ